MSERNGVRVIYPAWYERRRECIAAWVKAHNETEGDLAERLGYSRAYLSAVLGGSRYSPFLLGLLYGEMGRAPEPAGAEPAAPETREVTR